MARPNELVTVFTFDDRDGAKVDVLKKNFIEVNTEANSLKTDKSIGELTKLENAGLKSFNRLKDATNEINASPISLKPVTVPKSTFAELDKLQTRADQTRKSFSDIANTRLNSGNVNLLTKDIVTAHERSKQLVSDITQINNELKNPNRKSSIKFLTDELKSAELEADKLNRKLSALPGSQTPSRSRAGAGGGGGGRGRISSEQASLLELLDDFAPAGLNKPFNSIARGALIAGDLKEAATGIKAAGKEMLALVGISGTALATFGAIAVAGFLIVDATKKAREEAEKKLKFEEKLSGEYARQLKDQRDSLKTFQEQRKLAADSRSFSSFVGSATIDDLKSRLQTVEQLKNLVPNKLPDNKGVLTDNPAFQRLQSEAIAIDAQIETLQQRNIKSANDAFNQRNEFFKKSQENDLEAERRRVQANEKQIADLKKSKDLISDIGKTANNAFLNLAQKLNADNPFVKVFADSRSELDKLRASVKNLPDELQKSAIASQQAINKNNLFSARLDNNLSAFDLRETANRFRNPQPDSLVERQQFEQVIKNSIERGNFFPNFGGTYGSDLANRSGGFDKLTESQKRDIYEVSQLSLLLKDEKNSPLNAQNNRTVISALARERSISPDENLSVNERLQKQLSIINSGVSNDSERGIADRRLIGLTSGLDPAQIKADLREQIAAANEREAVRREKYESEVLKLQRDDLAIQERIAATQEKLLKIAEKEGFDGLNKLLITVKDETSGGVSTGSSGTDADVRSTYFDDAN